jgi:hypothetical protein
LAIITKSGNEIPVSVVAPNSLGENPLTHGFGSVTPLDVTIRISNGISMIGCDGVPVSVIMGIREDCDASICSLAPMLVYINILLRDAV